MRMIGSTLACAAAVGVLAGCAPGSENIQPGADGFSSAVTPDVREAFTAIDNYWEQTRNIGETGVKLVMLGEGEKYACPPSGTNQGRKITYDDAAPGYYCESNKTIVLPQLGWSLYSNDYLKAGGSLPDFDKLLIGHEYGHVLRQINNERQGLHEADNTPVIAIEKQADCIDGMAMKGLHVIPSEAWFKMIGDSENTTHDVDAHGTAPVRKQAFDDGQSHLFGDELKCGLTI